MIIECEKCRSKFNLDESLLKQGGSKVRCSRCKHVFTACPTEPELPEETLSDDALDELEETVALDSPPVLERAAEPSVTPAGEMDFEQAFKDALDEGPPVPLSIDQISEEEESLDVTEAMDRAATIEKKLTQKDLEEKVALKSGEPEEEVEKPRPRKEKRRFRLLPILLAVLVIIVGGGVGVYFLAPEMLPDSLSFLKPPQKEDIMDKGVARLSFKDVKGTFIQSEKAGQLFVIQGQITNHYPKGRSFILIKASLLDDKNKVVKTKMAYAGNTFTEDQLKTMPLEEINKQLKNRFGQKRLNFRVKPEGGVPFAIVIENLPENLSEFTVEAVSSTPDQQ